MGNWDHLLETDLGQELDEHLAALSLTLGIQKNYGMLSHQRDKSWGWLPCKLQYNTVFPTQAYSDMLSFVKCHEMTYAVNWHYTNKDCLIDLLIENMKKKHFFINILMVKSNTVTHTNLFTSDKRRNDVKKDKEHD